MCDFVPCGRILQRAYYARFFHVVIGSLRRLLGFLSVVINRGKYGFIQEQVVRKHHTNSSVAYHNNASKRPQMLQ